MVYVGGNKIAQCGSGWKMVENPNYRVSCGHWQLATPSLWNNSFLQVVSIFPPKFQVMYRSYRLGVRGSNSSRKYSNPGIELRLEPPGRTLSFLVAKPLWPSSQYTPQSVSNPSISPLMPYSLAHSPSSFYRSPVAPWTEHVGQKIHLIRPQVLSMLKLLTRIHESAPWHEIPTSQWSSKSQMRSPVRGARKHVRRGRAFQIEGFRFKEPRGSCNQRHSGIVEVVGS